MRHAWQHRPLGSEQAHVHVRLCAACMLGMRISQAGQGERCSSPEAGPLRLDTHTCVQPHAHMYMHTCTRTKRRSPADTRTWGWWLRRRPHANQPGTRLCCLRVRRDTRARTYGRVHMHTSSRTHLGDGHAAFHVQHGLARGFGFCARQANERRQALPLHLRARVCLQPTCVARGVRACFCECTHVLRMRAHMREHLRTCVCARVLLCVHARATHACTCA